MGPTHVRPAASTARAKSAFSARNPYPGWIASAPACFAARMCSSDARYDAISTLSSAERACRADASSGGATATVAMPSSRQARKTRTAISPRFATSSLRIAMAAEAYAGAFRGLRLRPAAPGGDEERERDDARDADDDQVDGERDPERAARDPRRGASSRSSSSPHPTALATAVVMNWFRLTCSSSALRETSAWRAGGMRRSRRPLKLGRSSSARRATCAIRRSV